MTDVRYEIDRRLRDGVRVAVVRGNARYQLRHHVRHSPDGFEYGYGGSGPSELARCILIDFLRIDPATQDPDYMAGGSLLPYQEFKWAFIAVLDQKVGSHTITGDQIQAWLVARTAT